LGGLLLPLIEAGYTQDAREVVEMYLEDDESTFVAISAALAISDLEACGRAAHTLVGSAGGIGATELADGLHALEDACRQRDAAEVRRVVPLVEAERERVRLTIRSFLATDPSDS
jgi:HPt (histidine-containing phosphotransfer) domain-containing protein